MNGSEKKSACPDAAESASAADAPDAACARHAPDAIPKSDFLEITQAGGDAPACARFFAFNTVVDVSIYGNNGRAQAAFGAALDACRIYERLFSRTLPHSDIARLNDASGKRVAIDARTADLLQHAQRYCAESGGLFDITICPAVRAWDFHAGKIADEAELGQAMAHVDWRNLSLGKDGRNFWAQLSDPCAAVDVGGIAKGWIADALVDLLGAYGLEGFIVNLGGNVAVGGSKPDGAPWYIGIRSPKDPSRTIGTIPIKRGSAVTSGTYERCFASEGVRYHHVLSPQDGLPVCTDIASATVIAQKSIDAEGYSTTLLALGLLRGMDFASRHPEIEQAIFVDHDENLVALYPPH